MVAEALARRQPPRRGNQSRGPQHLDRRNRLATSGSAKIAAASLASACRGNRASRGMIAFTTRP